MTLRLDIGDPNFASSFQTFLDSKRESKSDTRDAVADII